MTKTDFILFKEHYKQEDFEILSGCWFDAYKGLFDPYIDKYKEIKINLRNLLKEQILKYESKKALILPGIFLKNK